MMRDWKGSLASHALTSILVLLTGFLISGSLLHADECMQPSTNDAIARCLGNELRAADAKINETYQALLALATDPERTKFRNEQRQWIKERDDVCHSHSRNRDREDWFREVLGDYRKAVCVRRYTLFRTGELEQILVETKARRGAPATIRQPRVATPGDLAAFQVMSPIQRDQGRWYFEVTLKHRDIAKLTPTAMWMGCTEAQSGTSVGVLVQIRDFEGAPSNVRYGFALDVDGARLYTRVDGVWQDGEPGATDGIPARRARGYRCGLDSTVLVAPLIERGLLNVNFGKPWSFRDPLPPGYLAFDEALGNFASHRQQELFFLSHRPTTKRQYTGPILPSRSAMGKAEYLVGIAVSDSRGLAALGFESGDVSIVDLGSGEELRRFKAHALRTSTLRFSRSGQLLLTHSQFEDHVALWNVDSGEKVRTFAAGHGVGNALTVDFDTSGQYWFFGGDKGPTVYSVIKDVSSQNGESHFESAISVAAHPTENRVVAGSAAGDVAIYEYEYDQPSTTMRITRVAQARPYRVGEWVVGVVYSEDGRTVFTVSRAGRVDEWDGQNLTHRKSHNLGIGQVYNVAVAPDRRTFLVSGSIHRFDGLCAVREAYDDRAGLVEFNTRDGSYRSAVPPIVLFSAGAYLEPNLLVVGAGRELLFLDRTTLGPIGQVKLNFCPRRNRSSDRR